MQLAYPALRRSAASYLLHGVTIPEPYDYLEDPNHAETCAFVTAQNELFEKYAKDSHNLRENIFKSLSSMSDYPRTGIPRAYGKYYYYYHNTGLQNQNVLMRTQTLDPLEREVFLDPNSMSSDGTTALKTIKWSKTSSYAAYCVSAKGSDWQRIHVRVVETKEDTKDVLEWAKFTTIAWWGDYGFFYTRYPALSNQVDKGTETDTAKDAYICFHRIGTPQEEDITVLSVPEQPLWSLSAELSDCQKYILFSLFDGCKPNNLVWIAPLPEKPEDLKKPLSIDKLINEFRGQYEYLGNDGDLFYFETSHGAPNSKIVSLSLKDGTETDIVQERTAKLSLASLVKNTLLLVYLEDVKDVFYYRNLTDSSTLKKLDIPIGTIHTIFSERDKEMVSFKISSFLLPGRSFCFNINDPQGTLKHFKDDVIEGFNPDEFTTEQKFYESFDGVRVPMFIIHRKEYTANGTSPLLLYGYGGFNISLTPSFSASRIVFLKHLGGVVAIPNIRGGGEYGRRWYEDGHLAKKQNCFNDFIAAAKFLHQNKYGSPATTAIMGGSNGGLLVAASANQAPNLFKAVVCQVGVLDMYKFHKFTIGHAWTSDYGNPDNEEDFKILQKYSPIHNIQAGVKYPAVLVVTGDHDDRVVPLHSLKYIATLQHLNPQLGGPFLGRIEVAAGHGAGKPISKILQETSDIYMFIANNVGAKWSD